MGKLNLSITPDETIIRWNFENGYYNIRHLDISPTMIIGKGKSFREALAEAQQNRINLLSIHRGNTLKINLNKIMRG